MAKRKTTSPGAPADAHTLPPAAYSAEYPWWPAEFAPFKFAIMQMVFLVLLGGILYFAAITNGLVPFKQFFGWAIGMFDPLNLPDANSRDLASLIWCTCFVVGNGLIHPSLGLVSLATLRPWLDGYTFKNDNVYFLWGAVLLLALWGVRALLRNEPLRFPLLTALSSAYLIVALVLSPWSVQFGDTYKQLLLWTSYVAVFVVTLQNITTRRTQLFVLWAIVVGMALQAVFAILQYHYVLPFLRHLINQDPSVLKRFFGVDHVTAAMQHRFNKNRAFGTVLFPNALAAFLILGIPGCAMLLRNLLADALPAWAKRRQLMAPEGAPYRRRCIAAAGVVWFLSLVFFFSLTVIPTSYDFNSTQAQYSPPFYYGIYFLFGASAIVALIPALLYYLVAARHGFPFANQLGMAATLALSLLCLVWALWLSYSRGGIIALVLGIAVGAAVYFSPGGFAARVQRWLPHAAAILLCMAIGLTAFSTLNNVAEAQNNSAVTRQGEDVSFADLANPESFSLRLTYWRVALRMFVDNALTGVGLGGFKWAYPVYQQVGDGNVQEAHNGYLQAFAETGIIGGLALLAFWIWLMAWAAGRIMAEQNVARRRLMAGLFAGLAAFLLHAAIDINFPHPTLMFFAMLFAGLLCIFAGGDAPPVAIRSRMPLIAALLLGATFATGLSTRPWLQNLALSRMQFIGADPDGEMMKRFDVANYVIAAVPTAGRGSPRPVPVRGLMMLGVDLQFYVDKGRAYVPKNDGSGKLSPAEPGSAITPDTQLILQKPWWTMDQMRQDVRPWLESLKAEYARFPHDPQIAMHISNWYQLLTYWSRNFVEGDHALMREWSDETIADNPLNADVHVNKARSVLSEWRAHSDNLDLLREMVGLHEKACELAPAQHIFWYQLADAHKMLAEELEKVGDADGAKAARQREAEARTRGWEVLSWNQPEKDRKNPPPGMTGASEPANAAQS